jgi:hypothetical protein
MAQSNVQQILRKADDYVLLAMENLVDCIKQDEDDLARVFEELRTHFLFPTLNRAERLLLCRARFLAEELGEAGETDAPLNSKWAERARGIAAEREALQNRIGALRLTDRLTPVQVEILRSEFAVA